MTSGSEAGSYVRLIDFVTHPTLGWRVTKKKKRTSARRIMMRLLNGSARTPPNACTS